MVSLMFPSSTIVNMFVLLVKFLRQKAKSSGYFIKFDGEQTFEDHKRDSFNWCQKIV